MERCDVRVEVLSATFGLGSWVAMSGLWVELPILVQRLPERWALASQLALFLQMANIGPVLYGLLRGRCSERAATHAQLALGSVSTLLLVFLWRVSVGGRSLPFFLLSFGLSLVDCTSSLVFLPYMAHFRPCYLTPYLVGEGLSGFVPTLVAIAQGIGGGQPPECARNGTEGAGGAVVPPAAAEPRFSPECFFLILLLMLLLSWAAFGMLDHMTFCRKERVSQVPQQKSEMSPVKRRRYLYLLFLQGLASTATFGIFPAIQPYSALPYGDIPFFWTVTLCGAAYPAACLLAMWRSVRSVHCLSWLSLAATLVSLYALMTATLSPRPPLRDTHLGATLIVCCWVMFVFVFSYIKTAATVLLGRLGGHGALFWVGVVTQGGAVAGALLMFLLVNVFGLFQEEGMCLP